MLLDLISNNTGCDFTLFADRLCGRLSCCRGFAAYIRSCLLVSIVQIDSGRIFQTVEVGHLY